MWGLLLQVGIWAGLYIANYLLKPKNKPKPTTSDNYNLPRTEEGASVGIVFGRTRVESPLLVWRSSIASATYQLNGSYVKQYGLDMLFVVGIPMTGATSRFNILNPLTPRLYSVWLGDKKLPLKGGCLPNSGANGVGIVRAQAVHRKGFNGGPGQGGGVFGSYEWWWGSPDQDFRSPLSKIGDLMTNQLGDAALVPGYRNQMCVSFHKDDPDGAYGTGREATDGADEGGTHPQNWTLGESASLDGFSFEVGTYGAMDATVTTMTEPGRDFGGDADPVEVIYDVLTSSWSKVGLDSSLVDKASFLAASATLKSENHGYSMVHYDKDDAVSIITAVCKQIDAALYEEPLTGLFTLKLIRNDYDPATILSLDVPDIASFEDYGIGSWKNCANEVRVQFNDRSADYKQGTAVAKSQAAAVMNSNRRRVTTIDYPGISNGTIAAAVAARDLNTLSRPLRKVTIVAKRKAYNLRPGTCFKVTYPEYNLSGVVFRCGKVDVGQLFDNKVVIDAVEDVFASTYVGMVLPGLQPTWPVPYPFATQNEIADTGMVVADGIAVMEVPYWLSQEAKQIGVVNTTDAAHVMAVARPTINTIQYATWTRSRYGTTASKNQPPGMILIPSKTYYVDMPVTDLCTSFLVTADYARELEPYDTTTGLHVSQFEDPNKSLSDIGSAITAGVVPAAIAQDGQQLVLIVTPAGDMEFMAFEVATTGDGINYVFTNVWRGLMDTPAIRIPAGSRGYFVTPGLVGRRGYKVGETVDFEVVPHAKTIAGSGDDDKGSLLATGRQWLPVPVSDMRITGETITGTTGLPAVASQYKSVSLLEEGLDVYARTRLRQSATLVRGDTASEAAQDFSATTWVPFAYKTGVGESNLQGYGILNTNTGALTDVAGALVGQATLDGYGTLTVQMRSSRTIAAGDPGIGLGGLALGQVLASWDHPKVSVVAPEWRNLMGNPRFKYTSPTPWWALANMTIQTSASAPSLIATDKYIQGNSASAGTAAQTQPIDNWRPRGMTAIAAGYFRNFNADVNDTINMRSEALDASLASLGSLTTGPIAPVGTNWQYAEVAFTPLPANTAYVKWSCTFTEVAGGGTANVDTGFAEGNISVGQIYNATLNLLTNYSFATAGMGSWTVSAGTFTQPFAIPGPSLVYARGGTAATNTAYQEFTLPAGYECGATAVVRAWRAQVVTGDAGEVKVEVMNGASTVLASTTTGSETLATLNNWYRRTLSCDVPDGATKVRVTITGLKTTGADSGACFDEVRLSLHKKLDATFDHTVDCSAVPPQAQPATWQAYERDFANMFDALGYDYLARPRPLHVFSGNALTSGFQEQKGSANQMIEWSDNLNHAPGKMVGQWGSLVGSPWVDAFTFTRQAGGSAVCVEARDQAIDTLCAFDSGQSFTAIVFFRVDELTWAGTACGLVGRRDLTAGWELRINAAGALEAEIQGDGGTKTATVAGSVVDGAVHMGVIEYDATLKTLTCYSGEAGPGAAVSTAAGLGEFARTASACRFRIGKGSSSSNSMPGMISRVYVFDLALGEDGVAGHWVYADPPADAPGFAGVGVVMNQPAWCQVGADSGDVYVAAFSTTHNPRAYEDSTFGVAAPLAKGSTNRVPSWNFAGASWVKDAGASLVQGVEDNTGADLGVTVSATASDGFKVIGLTATATGTFTFIFWAKAASSVGVTLELMNASDVVKNSQTKTIGTTWTRYVVSFTGWDNSTGTLRVRIRSTAGNVTFTLGHVVWGQEGTEVPVLYQGPAVAMTDVYLTWAVSGVVARQLNSEGEIVVLGKSITTAPPANATLVNLKNNTNNQNRREVYALSTGVPVLHHYDGAAADVTSTGTAFDWSLAAGGLTSWRVRARWCRAMTLDNAANPFAGIVVDANVSSANYGRAATFSESSTADQTLEVGKGTNPGMNVLLRSVQLRYREEKLA